MIGGGFAGDILFFGGLGALLFGNWWAFLAVLVAAVVVYVVERVTE